MLWSTILTATLPLPSHQSKYFALAILCILVISDLNNIFEYKLGVSQWAILETAAVQWAMRVCFFMCIAASSRQIGVAYATATSTALATAVGLNLYTKVFSIFECQCHWKCYSFINSLSPVYFMTILVFDFSLESTTSGGSLGAFCSRGCS